jgi:hypothetical protein
MFLSFQNNQRQITIINKKIITKETPYKTKPQTTNNPTIFTIHENIIGITASSKLTCTTPSAIVFVYRQIAISKIMNDTNNHSL